MTTFTSEDRNGRDAKDIAFRTKNAAGKDIIMNEGYIQVILYFPAGKGRAYGGQRKSAKTGTQEYDEVVGYIKVDKGAKAAAVADKAIKLQRGKGNKINRKPTMEVDMKAQASPQATHDGQDDSANAKV